MQKPRPLKNTSDFVIEVWCLGNVNENRNPRISGCNIIYSHTPILAYI